MRRPAWSARLKPAYRAWQRLRFASAGTTGDTSRVSRHWSRLASDAFVRDLDRVSWTGIPQVHLNHNYLITGARDSYWVEWMRDRLFPGGEAGDVLSMGCGAGHLDRIFRRCGYRFRSFTGIDIAEGAVEQARALGSAVDLAPTVRYEAADLNRYRLPQGAFDFIYFFQSLHHLEALEHVLEQCQRALRPGGILLVNEFVGPSRFQWTAKQVKMANGLLALLPEELRRVGGGVKAEVDCPTIRQMMAQDPSEAVRSGEIEQQLKARFTIVDEWNWGGTLNHLVFHDIAANFDQDNARHRAIIEFLIAQENLVIREGLLPSDFKVFVGTA